MAEELDQLGLPGRAQLLNVLCVRQLDLCQALPEVLGKLKGVCPKRCFVAQIVEGRLPRNPSSQAREGLRHAPTHTRHTVSESIVGVGGAVDATGAAGGPGDVGLPTDTLSAIFVLP